MAKSIETSLDRFVGTFTGKVVFQKPDDTYASVRPLGESTTAGTRLTRVTVRKEGESEDRRAYLLSDKSTAVTDLCLQKTHQFGILPDNKLYVIQHDPNCQPVIEQQLPRR